MSQKQKRIITILGIVMVFLILSLIIVVIMDNQEDDLTDPNDVQISTELTYWGLWEPESVIQPIIEQYEALHPDVKIEYSQQSFTNYESRLYTRLQQASTSAEPAPDIVRINNSWTPKYYKYLSPLPTSTMDSTTYSEKFYPTAISDFTAKDGNIYAMPWEIDGLAIFYNKQLLSQAGVEEPPTDWDSFIELAKELTTKNSTGQISQSGLAIGTSRNITHSADILSYLMLLNGADIIDETYTSTNLVSNNVVTATYIYTNFALDKDPLWSSDLRNDLEMFYAGNLAMMFAPSWRAFDIIQSAPSIEFGIAPLPQLENNNQIYYSMYWGEAVTKTCSNPTVAWDFISFLVDHQQDIFSASSQVRAFGKPYSLTTLNSSLDSNPYLKAYTIMAPHMESWGMGDQMFVEKTLNNAITEIVEDGSDIQNALGNAQVDINDQLAQTNE